jgi:biopolymer transport protein TolR
MFVLLYVLMPLPGIPPMHGTNADLPKVDHSRPLPRALREDAVTVMITRDGSIYLTTELGSSHIRPDQLRPELHKEFARTGGERKVYIKADARVKYGFIKEVMDSIRAAGIENISFLTEERNPQPTKPN